MKKLALIISLILVSVPAFAFKEYARRFPTDTAMEVYTPNNPPSGGSGDITSVGDVASGAAFDGTQGTTITFYNAGGNATIDYDGTDFSFSKLISLGTNSLSMTGSIAATGARVTKGWFTDIESTNMPTVGGTSLSLTFQGLDADLTSIAGNTTGGFLTRTAANTYTARTIGEGLAIDVTNGDGVSGAPSIAFDPTELTGNRTWGDASTDTIVWTFDRATGTDSTITSLNGGIGVQSLTDSALTSGRVILAGASGILTDDSDMTFVTDTLTVTKIGATILSGTATLAENSSIALNPAGSADGKYSGITVTATAGYTQSFGDVVYLDPTDSRWELCDANSAAGADGDSRGIVGIVVSAGTDGNPCTILLQGIIRADAAFPTFTVNNPVYISETAGAATQTQPTTTDVVIRVIGFAITTDEMYFAPSPDYITHT